jgi:hypothetical protein
MIGVDTRLVKGIDRMYFDGYNIAHKQRRQGPCREALIIFWFKLIEKIQNNSRYRKNSMVY